MTEQTNYKRILVLATHCIGDSLLVTMLTRNLRNQYPDAQIDVLVTARGRLVFESNNDVNELIDFPQRPKIKDYYRFLQHHGRYDLVINERITDRTAVYCWLFGRSRLGVVDESLTGAWFKKWVYNHRILERTNSEHKMSRMARLLQQIQVNVEPRIQSPQAALPQALLQELPKDYIVVHAPSSNEIKQWPVEYWIQAIKSLLGLGYFIVLTGAPSERDSHIVSEIVSQLPNQGRLMSLLGQLSFAQTGTLLANCQGFVGPDSGPGHLAAGFSIPIISLISVAPASKWSPWPYGLEVDVQDNLYTNRIPVKQVHDNVTVLQSDRECVPCDGNRCKVSNELFSPCLRDITPQRVVEAVVDAIPLKDSV
ncbi:glycosyltransferase family 9 protein [Vibrio sp. FNV 38]|nr:glycosyltransferase family 9 protein [Vibrio sp. FNV 38]